MAMTQPLNQPSQAPFGQHPPLNLQLQNPNLTGFSQPPSQIQNFGDNSGNQQNPFLPTQGKASESKSIFNNLNPNIFSNPNQNSNAQNIFANNPLNVPIVSEQNKNQITETKSLNLQNQTQIKMNKVEEENTQVNFNVKKEDHKQINLFSMDNQAATSNLFNPHKKNDSLFDNKFTGINQFQAPSFPQAQLNTFENKSKEISK